MAMLARARRSGHVHCDFCYERGPQNPPRKKWRRAHKRQARAVEKRTWRRELS